MSGRRHAATASMNGMRKGPSKHAARKFERTQYAPRPPPAVGSKDRSFVHMRVSVSTVMVLQLMPFE